MSNKRELFALLIVDVKNKKICEQSFETLSEDWSFDTQILKIPKYLSSIDA